MGCNAFLHFYPQFQKKEVRVAITLLNSTCITVSVLNAPTSGYRVLCIPKESAKMQHCNARTSYTSNFNIKNITIQDKVYSKISKINFIYQVIWLM
jgi:hypothetical protein